MKEFRPRGVPGGPLDPPMLLPLTVFYVMKLLVSLITMTLQLSAQFSTYFKDCIVWADSRMLHNVVVLEGWKTEQRKINLLARFSLKI